MSFAVAWATSDFPAVKALTAHKKKIRVGVVGLHFNRTSPDFIKAHLKNKRVRFLHSGSGVFHPKAFLFEYEGGAWECIIGSANLTNGAFTENDEICLLFNSKTAGKHLASDLKAAIDDYFERAEPFDPDELPFYRVLWDRARRRANAEKKRAAASSIGRSPLKTKLLKLSWHQYSKRVRDDQHHSVKDRAAVLKEARALFEETVSFANMPDDTRKNLAGFKGSEDVKWGCFGSMKSARTFKTLVNDNNAHISAALDVIPAAGEITREQYLDYVQTFTHAFPHDKGHGLATVTRLLAMKRPDYFVCLDGPNIGGVKKAFGIHLKRHDYELYWDGVIERMLMSVWWNAPRPLKKLEAQIWDGRAAFLDSLFYNPDWLEA
ncbi:MAG: hypothetical protein KGL46_03175 [Hyphomicrobiales bacterium]|nr:hypothetical protein [Hyphomicrobiales bacterium]